MSALSCACGWSGQLPPNCTHCPYCGRDSSAATPPPTDADAGAFVEAVDELAAMVGSPFGEDRARRRVLSLHAAAVARAEAAERALDAIGRHTHIGAGDVVDDGPSPFMGGHR